MEANFNPWAENAEHVSNMMVDVGDDVKSSFIL